MSKRWGFYVDLTRCIGCYTCEIACRDYHLIHDGESWITLITAEEGEYPHPRVTHRPTACYHCDRPLCVEVCPVQAIAKDPETGIVTLDSSICSGCGACRTACPYDAPRWNPAQQIMGKCDLCRDRLTQGLQTICVDACPMRALAVGPLEKLTESYPDSHPLTNEEDPLGIGPRIQMKTKKK